VAVTVYEKRDKPYGIVRYVIPAFRISEEDIDRDYRLTEKWGVEFKFGIDENYSLGNLRKKHSFVVIASGAWKEGVSPVKTGGDAVMDALKFLEDSKRSGRALDLGKRVAVIGGGDVAMDCARAAKKNRGVEEARIVYRRTREFMPSQYEEQELALEEGVIFDELLAPLSFEKGILRCEKTRLAGYDASGRRGIEGTGQITETAFDTVIGAVGARVDTAPFTRNGIELDEKGFPRTGENGESSVPGVYIAGDCRAGAATVVKAIADGKTIAASILGKLGLLADFGGPEHSGERLPLVIAVDRAEKFYARKGVLVRASGGPSDGKRCLSCAEICEICVDVCPNRANVLIILDGEHQVVHIDRMCNECGNCASFCPHMGKPYRDKFTVFSSPVDFAESENPGFLKTGDAFRVRLEDKSIAEWKPGGGGLPGDYVWLIGTIMKDYSYFTRSTQS
jgi:putative selenate reductase